MYSICTLCVFLHVAVLYRTYMYIHDIYSCMCVYTHRCVYLYRCTPVQYNSGAHGSTQYTTWYTFI